MSISEAQPFQNTIGGNRIAPASFDVHPDTIDEIAALVPEGYNVRLHQTEDKYAMDAYNQARVDDEIVDLEKRTTVAIAETGENPLLLAEGRSAFANWAPLTKRAIALHNIYRPNSYTLGEGIDPDIYDRPLFPAVDREGREDLLSAAETLAISMKNSEKAAKIVQQYKDFISTPIDEPSRDIWLGARDGAGVRTRATCAMEECVVGHIESIEVDPEGITLASLACGAAGPVYQLMKALKDRGVPVKEAILADKDPMALASAFSLAETEGVAAQVNLQKQDLVDMNTLGARNLTEFIEPKSVDVVDLLGLFEYFPRPLAVSLLKEVQKIMKPGGIIVFGNMIDKRPQQTFFNDVSLWPPLEQRSLREMFDIIDEAGMGAKENAQILIPPQGVYAVVSIKVPENTQD